MSSSPLKKKTSSSSTETIKDDGSVDGSKGSGANVDGSVLTESSSSTRTGVVDASSSEPYDAASIPPPRPPSIGPLLPDGSFVPRFIGPLPAEENCNSRETRPKQGPLTKDGTFKHIRDTDLSRMQTRDAIMDRKKILEGPHTNEGDLHWLNNPGPSSSSRTTSSLDGATGVNGSVLSSSDQPMPSKKDLKDMGMPTEFASHGKAHSSPQKSVQPSHTKVASDGKALSPHQMRKAYLNVGLMIMLKQGYRLGRGLGKNEEGIREPLRPVIRKKRRGLGYIGPDDDSDSVLDTGADRDNDW